MSYGINPFKYLRYYEVFPHLSPLLGQPYMWKHHVIYEYDPRSVIFTLEGQLYRVPKVVSTTDISLISTK